MHALQAVFLLDWYVVGRTLVTSAVFFPRIDKVAGGTSLVQVVTGSPVGPWREIMQGLIGAIHGARHYIYVQTPYFLPTDSVLLALQTAALSGVDVRLMLPRRADSRLTHYGSCSYLEEMLQAGVKVYFYKAGFLHSKMLVVDDEFSTVGSTNIDFRSFEHNFEVNAFVYDAETTLCLKEIFLADQHSCEQVFLKHWLKRPLRHRVAESVVRLLSPLL